jgi:hypothetical protein
MHVEVEGGVATLTLNDQKKRNALSSQVAHGFCARHPWALVMQTHARAVFNASVRARAREYVFAPAQGCCPIFGTALQFSQA